MKHKKFVLLIVILVMTTLAMMMYTKRTIQTSENVNNPLACASLWVDNANTLEETIDCIDNNIGKTNNTKPGSRDYNS